MNSIGSMASKNNWNQKSSGPMFKKSAMLTDFAMSCRASTKASTSSESEGFSLSAGLSPPTKLILVPGGCEYRNGIYLRSIKIYEGIKHYIGSIHVKYENDKSKCMEPPSPIVNDVEMFGANLSQVCFQK